MSITLHHLAPCITAHAWNQDRTKVAICPNTSEVIIYAKTATGWNPEVTFKEHDSLVTGIDWAPNTNRIVTCSQDRNAYVWSLESGQWKPSLVILRLNRGCTTVKWSPREDKFAVGSGAAAISVCYYVADNSWWLSKLIKGDKSGINSTITSIAWHPNNVLLAAGGTDSKARVFSGFVKDLDDRKIVAAGTAFGKRLPFATLLAEFPTTGWVQSIAFSPSGNQLAWTTRDASIQFLECSTTEHTMQTLKCRGLPYTACLWAGENSFVVGGHDCVPVLFQGGPGQYRYIKDLDAGDGAASKTQKNIWEQRTDLGTEEGGDVGLPSRHQNRIIELSAYNPSSFSSVGWDGNLVVWSYTACGANIQ